MTITTKFVPVYDEKFGKKIKQKNEGMGESDHKKYDQTSRLETVDMKKVHPVQLTPHFEYIFVNFHFFDAQPLIHLLFSFECHT